MAGNDAKHHVAKLLEHISSLTADPSIPLDTSLFDTPERNSKIYSPLS